MPATDETFLLPLSREELAELFCRCLKSAEDDNDASQSALAKLARALECDWDHRLSA
jgi:hypothetical protein